MREVKTVIIGIDGGGFDYINPLMKKNLLPNFQKLIDFGFSAKLEVTLPPVTIPSWPCIFSGLSVERLGHYWFDHPTKGLFNSNFWKEKSIFSIKGLKQFVLNVPGTFPAWQINGEMVTGMMSPHLSCFPPELSFFLKKDWIIDGKNIKDCFNAFEIKSKLFKTRINENYELLTFVIRLPDSLSHHSHLNRELVNNYIYLGYMKIDAFLGELLNDQSIDNIFIVSDHGLKFFNHEFNLSRWFEKKGLISVNNSKQGKIYSIIAKGYDYIRQYIRIDYEKYKFIKNRFLKAAIKDAISTKENVNKTRLMAFFGGAGSVFLMEEDKPKLDIIIQALKQEKRISQIKKVNEKGYPDIFILLNDKYIFSHNSSYFLTRRRNTISHTPWGLFIAYGKNVIKGNLKFVKYQDIAPTILKLCNQQKPDHMLGNALNILKV